jgi:ribosomal protein S12 methylthiotransferase
MAPPTPQTFYLISLGCPKNLVDSEGVATLLHRQGYTAAASPEEADLLLVNTCGFIASAREEARAVLADLRAGKQPHQRIVALGCYAQRAPEALAEAVPGIDALIGTRRWMDVAGELAALEEAAPETLPRIHTPATYGAEDEIEDIPRVAVQGSSAYLKIAEGCRRACAFCAIPLIKGPQISRPPEDVIEDAVWLAERGIEEIILIAQDTTDYGRDRGERGGLIPLLEALTAAVPDVPWIRLMYAYPGPTIDRLAETMARHPQILPYVDLPLQHAHPDVLRRMRRPADVEATKHNIETLRAAMPEIAIRTTFLVGFPGESEEEFQALLDFVAEMAFDRVGVFTYSPEEGTAAADMVDTVSPAVKEARRERLMALQQPISLAKNQAMIGRTVDVLTEGRGEGLTVGRSYRDAPEIDGLVLVQGELPVGHIQPVRVTAALEYDLIGEPLR